MHDADDLYRERSRRLARRPVAFPFATGTPAMAGYVTSVPSVTNPFISMHPVTIGGDEVEGGAFTRNVSEDSLIFAGVGKKPLAGVDLIAGFFPDRWAGFIRSDTLVDDCDDTTKTIKLSITACAAFTVGAEAPKDWYVTITRDGVLVNDGMTTFDPSVGGGGASIYIYAIAKPGTYVVTAAKSLFATQTYTRTYACGSANIAVGGPGYPAPGYTLLLQCQQNPISQSLTMNDGLGDIPFQYGVDGLGHTIGACSTGPNHTEDFTRVNNTILRFKCNSPTAPVYTDQDVPLEITWNPADGATLLGGWCYADLAGTIKKMYPGSGSDPGQGLHSAIGTVVSHAITCSPFRSTTVLNIPPPLDEIYGGSATIEVTE